MDYSLVYNSVESYLMSLGDIDIQSGREFSYEFDDESGFHIIKVPPKSKNTLSGIIGLLHEYGHARSPKTPFLNMAGKPLILEREFKAWEVGRKILKKLKLQELDSEYCKEWARCWNTYIEFQNYS